MTTQQHTLTFRFLAEPTDVNFGGKVHGGAVMKWIDQAGFACASAWSGEYCVTVYTGGIRFLKPILIGSMVEVSAQIVYTGSTSMHVAVDVWSSNIRTGERHKTTHCIIVFVAVDAAGSPVAVPKWQPQSEREKQLERYAINLMELRKGVEAEMLAFVGED